MHKARYVLVPCGENAESYRLWEAMHAGAIPIVETCGNPDIHPLRVRMNYYYVTMMLLTCLFN